MVLHLRGQNASRTSAIYGRALAITTSILRKHHPVYLHSVSATQAEFKLWHWAFPKLLIGCSWLTAADDDCWPMLWMLPSGTLALETDSPHLALRIGWVNSPMRIWAQAESIVEIRNVPVTLLLVCSHRVLQHFDSLWVLELDWTIFNLWNERSYEWKTSTLWRFSGADPSFRVRSTPA